MIHSHMYSNLWGLLHKVLYLQHTVHAVVLLGIVFVHKADEFKPFEDKVIHKYK